jgi:four helix bundle protein
MNEKDIYAKCENFTVNIIELFESIPYRRSVGIIGDQLMRSSGSVGANLNEANNARTKREFVGCIGISLKEVKETLYWLKVLGRTNQHCCSRISRLLEEANSIKRILGRIYWSAKKNSND